MFSRPNVHRLHVRSTRCPFGNMSVDLTSVRQYVCRLSVCRPNVRRHHVREPMRHYKKIKVIMNVLLVLVAMFDIRGLTCWESEYWITLIFLINLIEFIPCVTLLLKNIEQERRKMVSIVHIKYKNLSSHY